MLGGGLPVGFFASRGRAIRFRKKTILATQFLAEGVRQGEPGVIAAFEKSPSQLLNNKLHALVKAGQVGVIDTRALDLSIDETLHDLIEMISRMQAKRVVIDSLSGFELALAPQFSDDFSRIAVSDDCPAYCHGRDDTDDRGTGRPLHRFAL
ncbi:RAD55 family ATPase [Undibacterium arcticum]